MNQITNGIICTSSNKSIIEDMKVCSHFLYSSSTAAVECLSYGLTPIYYNFNNDLNSLDGYEIPKKFTAHNHKDIKKILQYKISNSYKDRVLESHSTSFNMNLLKS